MVALRRGPATPSLFFFCPPRTPACFCVSRCRRRDSLRRFRLSVCGGGVLAYLVRFSAGGGERRLA